MADNNIIFIGMPAVGKSTVGVVIAKRLGYRFVDTDILIQESEGKLLKDIIADVGPDGFLKVEDRVNAQVKAERTVISPGGSVVYCENAMKHYKEIGKVVYLQASFEIINSRLKNAKGRGVVLRDGQTLKDLYDERVKLFEKYADITVCEDNQKLEDTIESVLDAFSYEIMCQGKEKLQYYIDDYNRRSATLSKKEQDTMKDMKIVQEMYARGFEFEPLDIYKAQATKFLIVNGKLMPPLSSIDGMGEKAAEAVAEASKDGTYLSLDDFRQRTKASKTVIDTMVDLGILADLPASNQLSLFDF